MRMIPGGGGSRFIPDHSTESVSDEERGGSWFGLGACIFLQFLQKKMGGLVAHQANQSGGCRDRFHYCRPLAAGRLKTAGLELTLHFSVLTPFVRGPRLLPPLVR